MPGSIFKFHKKFCVYILVNLKFLHLFLIFAVIISDIHFFKFLLAYHTLLALYSDLVCCKPTFFSCSI